MKRQDGRNMGLMVLPGSCITDKEREEKEEAEGGTRFKRQKAGE